MSEVDNSGALGEFLRSRRGRVDPQVSVIAQGRRRTPGLRREEVAAQAGVSAEYYTRLEQGRRLRPSPAVVEGLARVLNLTDVETEHLRVLAGMPSKPAWTDKVRPELAALVAGCGGPTLLLNPRMDVLAWNEPAQRLMVDFAALAPARRNMVRLLFLEPAQRDLYANWQDVARGTVAHLRAAQGQYPTDRRMASLVAELMRESAEFRRLWAQHSVCPKHFGTKVFDRPETGMVSVHYETLAVADGSGQTLVMFSGGPRPASGGTQIAGVAGSSAA